MHWLRQIARISVLFKIASFKTRVKRAQHRGGIIFIILFFVMTAALLWFGRGFIRNSIEDYQDGKLTEDFPEAQVHMPSESLVVSTDLIPIEEVEANENSLAVIPEIFEENYPGSQEEVLDILNEEMPAELNLKIPFTSQAPHANWDLPYQEACEEASVYMASLFFAGDKRSKIPPSEADSELIKLVDWQTQNLGHYEDTSVKETTRILSEYYGLDFEVIVKPTVDDIKTMLARGYPVIVPAYGKALPNPYFSGDGPLYHMLLIKGYLEDRFIVNDPGTRRGADFTYEFNHFMPAIHDWKDGDVQNGQPMVIVVTGPVS